MVINGRSSIVYQSLMFPGFDALILMIDFDASKYLILISYLVLIELKQTD